MAAKKKVAPSTAAPMDETKRKFREALEAKQGRQAEGEAHLDTEASQTQAHGRDDLHTGAATERGTQREAQVRVLARRIGLAHAEQSGRRCRRCQGRWSRPVRW